MNIKKILKNTGEEIPKVKFECIAHKVTQSEEDNKTITASLKNLNILEKSELKDNPNFLFFEGDLANAHKINKNGHGLTIQEAINVYKKWEYSFIDIEHNRDNICGFIIKSVLTDPETKQILTEEEAASYNKPINISVGFIVWDNVDENLSKILKQVGNVDNNCHGLISLSLELSYDQFDIYRGESSNMFEGEIISNEEEIEKIYNNLKEFGGSGKDENGNSIYLLAMGTTPLGAGLVVNPAAHVNGVKQVMANNECEEDCECEKCLLSRLDLKNSEIISSFNKNIEIILEKIKNIENNGSHLEKTNVRAVSMKIKNISDINDENLKEIKASDLTSFIADEIGKASEKASEDLKAKENELVELKNSLAEEKDKNEKISASLENINSELNSLKSQLEQEKLEASFNLRMTSLDEEFELDDNAREVIASQIRNLDEEAFASWKKSFDILAAEKNKEFIKANKKEITASTKTEDNADPLDEIKNKINASVPSSVNLSEETINSYKEAFAIGKGITIEL